MIFLFYLLISITFANECELCVDVLTDIVGPLELHHKEHHGELHHREHEHREHEHREHREHHGELHHREHHGEHEHRHREHREHEHREHREHEHREHHGELHHREHHGEHEHGEHEHRHREHREHEHREHREHEHREHHGERKTIYTYCLDKSLTESEKKLCHALSPFKDIIHKALADVARPIHICLKLATKNQEICTLKYEKEDSLYNEEYETMRIVQLKDLAKNKSIQCKGCRNKQDYINVLRNNKEL